MFKVKSFPFGQLVAVKKELSASIFTFYTSYFLIHTDAKTVHNFYIYYFEYIQV